MTALDNARPMDSMAGSFAPLQADHLPLLQSSEGALAADQEAALRYSPRAGAGVELLQMLGLVAS